MLVTVGQSITVRSELHRSDGLLDRQHFHAEITKVGTHNAEYRRTDTILEENVLHRHEEGGFSLSASPEILGAIGIHF